MKKVISGLERLINEPELQNKIKGNIGLICHSASVDSEYNHSVALVQKVFGKRLVKLFGPQHGFVADVQDNMIETKDYIHPFFQLPVFSLYSETRAPTDEMLEGIDSLIIDLQDVGTRVYTYVSTMTLAMEACAKHGIEIIILDRPNPVGGKIIEGNMLDENFASFVGRHPIPMRHGMTIGEMAHFAKKYYIPNVSLTVIAMEGWTREMFYWDTSLPWIPPSPNLPTIEGAITFVGTVLFEGTNISEGRGTTRSLEIVGHPDIEPFSFHNKLIRELAHTDLKGFVLRPLVFLPTFQKYKDTPCGGVHIHVTDKEKFLPWKLGQFLCRQLYTELAESFEWTQPPYEYEFEKLPIDLINGSEKIREWVENSGDMNQLSKLEKMNLSDFISRRENVLLYS